MARLGIFRSIAVVAASLAVGAGPQLALCDEQQSSNTIIGASSSLASSIPLEQEASAQLLDSDSSNSQRRELSWWSLALQLVHPCPPPGHHQPPRCGGGGSNGGGSSGGGGSGGSGGGGSGSGGGGSGGSGGGGGGGGGGGSGNGEDGDGYSGTTTHKSSVVGPGTLGFWMLIAASAAAGIAIAAMVIGSRRKAKAQYHPLKGSIERRMKLFGDMADGCFEERELCAAQNESGVGDGGLEMKNGMDMDGPGEGYKEIV